MFRQRAFDKRGFSPKTRKILHDLARVAMPAGQNIPAGGDESVDRLEALLRGQPGAWRASYAAMAKLFQQLPLLRYHRRFTDLSPADQLEFLDGLYQGHFPGRMLLRVLLTLLKTCHYDDPGIHEHLECKFSADEVADERPRYLERAIDMSSEDSPLDDGEVIEAEIVIVGSGAGGAALAAELAEMGHAVVILEQGHYFRRPDFSGRPLEMLLSMYQDMGLTGTAGNCFIPVPLGRCVGGTTTINSGTCYRLPERVMARWRRRFGLYDFTPEAMDPYYAKVEKIIQVTRAEPRWVGGIGDVISRGCEALGYTRHGPLLRNAPDCDGQSLCCFGCPTDAKRSANVSYVPLALKYGANLFHNARMDRIILKSGRAAGVEVRGANGVRFSIRAPAVVLAAGTVGTPAILLKNRLANRNRQVGKNLSIHPAVGIFGKFPDRIAGCNSIPQGYGVEEFHDEGIMFEGAFLPPDMGAGGVTFFGESFTDVMENYQNVGFFGFMIEDTSRGRVILGPGSTPIMTYVLNRHDVSRLKRGVETLMRIFLAGGAERVFPQMAGFVEINDHADVERFRRTQFKARDFDLTAHHPLGTCRMGRDPRTSVVGVDHQTHEVPGLFVTDGSAVPSALGVNPMLTIMAMATRAATPVSRAVS